MLLSLKLRDALTGDTVWMASEFFCGLGRSLLDWSMGELSAIGLRGGILF